MPAAPSLKPTQASPLPTMNAGPATPVRPTAAEESPRSLRRALILALAGVAAILLAIVIGYFVLFTGRNRTQAELATALPSPTPTAQSSAMPVASPAQTPSPTTKPTSSPSPASKSEAKPSPKDSPKGLPKPATLDADPTLFPSPENSTTDYGRILTTREVDQPVRILSRPSPTYTDEARRNQISGTVVLRAVFSSSGIVTNIHAVSGLPNGLTERAIAAAKQIRFTPATKDGRPVSMWMELQYDFNLY